MTTYAAFIDSLEALVVTGVTRRYTSGAPSSLNTADLPAQWVELPSGTITPAYADGGIQRTMTAALVIAVEPVGQNTRPANFAACVTIIDNVHTALDAWADPLTGPPSWVSRLAYVPVNTVDYWAIVTEVSGLG